MHATAIKRWEQNQRSLDGRSVWSLPNQQDRTQRIFKLETDDARYRDRHLCSNPVKRAVITTLKANHARRVSDFFAHAKKQ